MIMAEHSLCESDCNCIDLILACWLILVLALLSSRPQATAKHTYKKVVDKAITMDNLQFLCLVVNICRETARRSLYKYSIIARWKFCSRFINKFKT